LKTEYGEQEHGVANSPTGGGFAGTAIKLTGSDAATLKQQQKGEFTMLAAELTSKVRELKN